MGRKKKRKKSNIQPRPDRKDVLLAETRSADAATVAWTLAAMATLGALALRGLVQLIIRSPADLKSLPPATLYIPGLMHFAALICGILAISATPLIYRLRKSPPPWQVTAAIVLIGLAPLLLLALDW